MAEGIVTRTACLVLSLLIGVGGVLAQDTASNEAAEKPIPLQLTSVLVTSKPITMTFGPSFCDAKGNVFTGIYAGSEKSRYMTSIDSQGAIKAEFHPEPSETENQLGDFYFAEGSVYQIVAETRKRRIVVVRFDEKGVVKSRTALEQYFEPTGAFGVFKSGEILVAGVESGERSQLKPFTAVFSSDGKLLKKISFEEDEKIVEAVNTHNESFVPSNQNYRNNAAVNYGVLTSASDGNLYLMRHTLPAIIYVVSPSGSVVRTLKVTPSDPRLVPRAMFESESQLAVAFTSWANQNEKSQTEIVVVNTSTGEVIRTFSGGDLFRSGLVCFKAPDQFTFISGVDKKLALKIAAP